MTRRVTNHIEALSPIFDINHLAAADIGAGSGEFARVMAVNGASVAAVEIDATRFDRNEGVSPGSVTYHEGRGEKLPFETASLDLVTFMFSFHHVPGEHQPAALAEAHRVLRGTGRLHVVEPLPECALNEVIAPLVDETEILDRSRAFLQVQGETGFKLLQRIEYVIPYHYASARALIDSIVEVDPERAALAPSVEDEVKRRFELLAMSDGDRFLFEQPCIGFHFEVA